MMASSNRDWAWLPFEILSSIQEKLIEFGDFIRFCAICSNWRYVALNGANHHDHIHMIKLDILKTCNNQLPLLMIEDRDSKEENRSFYSIMDEKMYKLQLPMPNNRRCVGSSQGWVFTVEDSLAVSLINPFSGRILHLPLLRDPSNIYKHWVGTDTYDYFINKGILLSDACLNPDDYGVILIYGDMKDLAFFKSSDKSWTFINKKRCYTIEDVIYYKGKIYCVSAWSKLVSIDLSKGEVSVKIKESSTTTICSESTYLVESVEGDLLMVQRFLGPISEEVHEYRTSVFKVFKWSHSVHGKAKAIWVQIESLGDQALFLGRNQSISISTSDFPGCQRNCIYYTDDYYTTFVDYVPHGPDEDTGFFKLEDGSFGTHYIADPLYKPKMPPIWVVPNLKGT